MMLLVMLSRVAVRSYEVRARNGVVYRRNRRMLKPFLTYPNTSEVGSDQVLTTVSPVANQITGGLAVPLRRSPRTRRQPDRWTPGCLYVLLRGDMWVCNYYVTNMLSFALGLVAIIMLINYK